MYFFASFSNILINNPPIIFLFFSGLVTFFNLAKKISEEQVKKNKKLKIFIQVNIGNEDQKSGINPAKLKDFYQLCIGDLDLDIIGLMCIPPAIEDMSHYFSAMNKLNKLIGLNELSMGMSSDYLKATSHGATFVRIGSKIFGDRS